MTLNKCAQSLIWMANDWRSALSQFLTCFRHFCWFLPYDYPLRAGLTTMEQKPFWIRNWILMYIYEQVDIFKNLSHLENPCYRYLFQKHFFLHQLTHNMTKDCSWNYHENYKRRTWAEHGQNMFCPCSALVVFMVIPWTICCHIVG